MKIQEFFRFFVRIHYKGIKLSNNELDSLALDFESYLFKKVGEEKARSWYPESITKLVMQSKHPFKSNGFEPALVLHFCDYIDSEKEKANAPIIPKDKNGKLLKTRDKVHIVGRGDIVLYIVEIKGNNALVNSDVDATTGDSVPFEKLVKFKNQN